jgi:hypothetical protein
MTRKDYQAIARVISTTTRHVMPHQEWQFMVMSLGNQFARTNERFDHDRWFEACDTEYREGA